MGLCRSISPPARGSIGPCKSMSPCRTPSRSKSPAARVEKDRSLTPKSVSPRGRPGSRSSSPQRSDAEVSIFSIYFKNKFSNSWLGNRHFFEVLIT